MSNRCPVCAGLGRVLAFGVGGDPAILRCPECAGLAITPASADDPCRRNQVRVEPSQTEDPSAGEAA